MLHSHYMLHMFAFPVLSLSTPPTPPSLVCLRDFITTEQQSAQGSGGCAARTLEQQSFSALLPSVNLKQLVNGKHRSSSHCPLKCLGVLFFLNEMFR